MPRRSRRTHTPSLSALARTVVVGALTIVGFVSAGAAGPAPAVASVIHGAGSSTVTVREAPHASGFTIAGSVAGLYPGHSRFLTLTVTNPQHFTIIVKRIGTTVTSTRVGCPSADLIVSTFVGSALVAAHHSRSVSVLATLSAQAPNGCQGARFVLHYLGSATA